MAITAITAACELPRRSNWPLILLGGLNTDFRDLGDINQVGAERRMETLALIESFGFQDMREAFRQRQQWQRK